MTLLNITETAIKSIRKNKKKWLSFLAFSPPEKGKDKGSRHSCSFIIIHADDRDLVGNEVNPQQHNTRSGLEHI